MDDQAVAAAVGVAAYITVRVVDYILPSNRRFRLMDRWTVERDDDDTHRDTDTPNG